MVENRALDPIGHEQPSFSDSAPGELLWARHLYETPFAIQALFNDLSHTTTPAGSSEVTGILIQDTVRQEYNFSAPRKRNLIGLRFLFAVCFDEFQCQTRKNGTDQK